MKQQSLDKRLNLYLSEKGSRDVSANTLLLAASAVAGVGAALVPPPAEAAIVYSGVLQENEVKVGAESYKVDFDADNNPEFTFELVTETGGSYFQYLKAKSSAEVIKSNDNPARLVSNYAVLDNANFSNIGLTSELAFVDSGNGGNFISGEPGFLGIRFEIDGLKHYGWIQYKANSDATIGTIIDWAYENTPGKAIKTGDKKNFNWNLFLPAIIAGGGNG